MSRHCVAGIKVQMINSSRALVFAMLSSASGWGLPSHDPLLSSNESTDITGGVDGPRDRRQRQKYRRSGAAQRHISAWGEGKEREKLDSKRPFFLLNFRDFREGAGWLTTMQEVVREAQGGAGL
eukprot:scaffold91898_cov69-Phaeocystis_antarctica.AAC.1